MNKVEYEDSLQEELKKDIKTLKFRLEALAWLMLAQSTTLMIVSMGLTYKILNG